MSFSIPLNDENARVRLVKKGDMGAHKETKRPAFPSAPPPAPAAESSSATPTGHPAGGSPPHGANISATVVPAPKVTEPKVQLVEVEPGIYDIYFTCSCCEQYVIRCESLEKAASAPPSAS